MALAASMPWPYWSCIQQVMGGKDYKWMEDLVDVTFSHESFFHCDAFGMLVQWDPGPHHDVGASPKIKFHDASLGYLSPWLHYMCYLLSMTQHSQWLQHKEVWIWSSTEEGAIKLTALWSIDDHCCLVQQWWLPAHWKKFSWCFQLYSNLEYMSGH